MTLPALASPDLKQFSLRIAQGQNTKERIKAAVLQNIPEEAREIAEEIADLTSSWNPVES